MLPLVMAGISMATSAYGAYQNEQNRKRQIAGLKSLRDTTPSERKYMTRRREIIEGGDPILNEQFKRNVGTIRQQGQFSRQRSQGAIIGQGLEGSIVAQELRRKVDKDVLRSVAGQAKELAVRNAKLRQDAELDIENMELGIADRGAQVDSKIAQIGGYDRAGTLANIAMAGVSGYVGAGGDFGIKTDSAFMKKLGGLDDSAFESLMGDPDSLSQFKEGLSGTELLEFSQFLGTKQTEQKVREEARMDFPASSELRRESSDPDYLSNFNKVPEYNTDFSQPHPGSASTFPINYNMQLNPPRHLQYNNDPRLYSPYSSSLLWGGLRKKRAK